MSNLNLNLNIFEFSCEIVDDGGKKPIFQVTPADQPDVHIRTPSSSAAWKRVLVEVNNSRQRLEGKVWIFICLFDFDRVFVCLYIYFYIQVR